MKTDRHAGITRFFEGDVSINVHDAGIIAIMVKGDYVARVSALYGRQGLETGVQRNFDVDPAGAVEFLTAFEHCLAAARKEIAKGVK